MKTAIMQIAIAAALAAAAPHALAADQVRNADEVLGSWTGTLPGASTGDVGRRAAIGDGRAPTPDPLASWTGAIPVASVDGQGTRAGSADLRPARPLGAARLLASWSSSP
jgi:hypothetical protein